MADAQLQADDRGGNPVAGRTGIEYRPATMDATLATPLPRLADTTLDITADQSIAGRQSLAWRDVGDGLGLWRLGLRLGWLDIKLKYRGSLLGPFWLTISTGVMVAAMGGLYGTLFHMDLASYLPFLALSLVTWNALSGHVSDSCTTFLGAEGLIRSLRMPFFVHAMRAVIRTAISFIHNLPVVAAVFAIYGIWPGATALLAIPGMALWTLDAFAACLLLGAFCARFRDIPPIVGSIMQIAFFVTPVVWRPEQLGAKGWWLPFNPFDALLEIVRAPLLGHAASAQTWGLAAFDSAILCGVTWMFFARIRSRIAYWM